MPISREFVLAGEAVFTIDTPDHGHYTFRVVHKAASDRYKETWFVHVFTGTDNTSPSDYTYLGILDVFTSQVRTTKPSQKFADSLPLRLLNRVLARVWSEDHAAYERHGFKTHHEGKCGRCGRTLTNPLSIETGIGPECARKMGIVRDAEDAEEADFGCGICGEDECHCHEAVTGAPMHCSIN